MRFDLYDTLGKVRNISADVDVDEMRCLLSEFKTHCAMDRSAYEFNHFSNWAKKNHDVIIKYVSDKAVRVDM
jgi:hypothetical protein